MIVRRKRHSTASVHRTGSAHAGPASVVTRAVPRRAAIAGALLTVGLLGGCAVAPMPLSVEEHQQRVEQDRQMLFTAQEAVAGPITLYEAMARAVKYNLDHRLKAMEAAYAERQLDLSRFDLMPQVLAGAGLSHRSNESGASSLSLLTGTQSLEPSTSQEQNRQVSDLQFVWNVLDFGVGYVRAQQAADQLLIAQERRRKVVHNIIQEVRAAYWRAVSAERLLARVDPLLVRVSAARAGAQAIETQQLSAPMEALGYQRTVLDTLRQLQTLRRELSLAKTQLAALMNLPLDQDFQLAMPSETAAWQLPEVPAQPGELERMALLHRPELVEEAYQARISAAESQKALLQLLPGVELNYGFNQDSNSYLFNNYWREGGLRVTWNLLNVFSAKPRLEAAAAQEDLARARRLALNMAVMTQVHIARLRAQQAVQEFQTAEELHGVEGRILTQLQAGAQTRRLGEMEVIRGELNAVVAQLRRDMAFAEADSALGQVLVSIGADPLPDAVESDDVKTLTKAIESALAQWAKGVPPEKVAAITPAP